jgi:thioesterase domain-containing protein
LRGFAALVATQLVGAGVALEHIGIGDPRIAPSDDYRKVWDHFGITPEAVAEAIGAPSP